MRLPRAPVADLAPGPRRLDARTARYLARVLRLREGDRFVAFDPARAVEGDARITSLDGDAAAVDVSALARSRVVAARSTLWIQGLAKGDKCDAIVRDATELGATAVVIATTARAVVKLDPARAAARLERWRRIAGEAARQCGRGDAPSVDLAPWGEALARAPAGSARFCLYEAAVAPLGPPLLAALDDGRALAFAAGPEGGLTDEEARAAEDADYACVSLGPFILRTETAAAAVLGAARVWG